ncbi:MAG TPA: DUF3025 domain-containing protein [Accumulibacter sp.]|nr:DUF3025 domain-containing protein [Accumulibacter sp.]
MAEWPSAGGLFAPLALLLPSLPATPALPLLEPLLSQRAILTQSAQALRFVAPPNDGLAYEQRIWQRGEVATRPENWHDFFNALVWLTFPRSKAVLNARHVRLSTQESVRRGRGRDALTHFDECGALLLASDRSLLELVREFRWKTLFWQRRDALHSSLRCFIFGHGSYEQLLQPFRGLTAKALLYEVDATWLRQPLAEQLQRLDRLVADDWRQDRYDQPRALQPLPLMGFPGLTPDNQCAGYYDDSWQFRPGRRQAGV